MREVLHITAWYPNALIAHEAPFIERHIRALDPHVHNTVWHIDVRQDKDSRSIRTGPRADRTFLRCTRMQRWMLIEITATLTILWAWCTRDRSRPVDLINFHIAYPNCTHIGVLRWIMRRPMIITEHFSAYNRGYNATSKGADRIRRIFHRNVPVIVVSRALQGDITRFAGGTAPHFHVVGNAVDTSIFKPVAGVIPEEGRFFTIAGWRKPKRADLLLDAMAAMRKNGIPVRLRMAGDGPLMPSIKERIAALELGDHVDLLGQLDEHDVADEMRRAHALVHASDYETFSAVCAEALCCGTPVIASRVGGIPEFVAEDLGTLVAQNDPTAWATAWGDAWTACWTQDRARTSAIMSARVDAKVVGTRYHAVLLSTMKGVA